MSPALVAALAEIAMGVMALCAAAVVIGRIVIDHRETKALNHWLSSREEAP